MEEALRAHILTLSGLSALVGSRVDWVLSPQGRPYPSAVLHLISDVRPMNLAEPGAWSRSRVQVDCWDKTHKGARNVAAIVAGLHGLRATFSNIRFRIFVVDRDTSTAEDSATSSGVVHRSRLDLNVWWSPLSGA